MARFKAPKRFSVATIRITAEDRERVIRAADLSGSRSVAQFCEDAVLEKAKGLLDEANGS